MVFVWSPSVMGIPTTPRCRERPDLCLCTERLGVGLDTMITAVGLSPWHRLTFCCRSDRAIGGSPVDQALIATVLLLFMVQAQAILDGDRVDCDSADPADPDLSGSRRSGCVLGRRDPVIEQFL